jgi:hypothetical protein
MQQLPEILECSVIERNAIFMLEREKEGWWGKYWEQANFTHWAMWAAA